MGVWQGATDSGPREKTVKTGADGGRIVGNQEAEGLFVFSGKLFVKCHLLRLEEHI